MADLATGYHQPAAEEPLRVGASFSWSTYGMDITSTVYVLDEGALWGGTANGITGVHEWHVDVRDYRT
jgi:hypothetical protein